MIHTVKEPGGVPLLAMDDPEVGPKLRDCRVYTPKEVQREAVLTRLRQQLGDLKRIEPALAEEMTKALTDADTFKRLTESHFSLGERIRMGYWDAEEGEEFRSLDEGVLLKDFVIRAYRPDLRGYRIVVLFQLKLTPANRRERIGTAMKLPGKMHHVSGVDAIITLSFLRWRGLSDTDRQRLVHHELEHLVVEDGGLKGRGHDFEDFASIVETYGIRSESGGMNMDGDVGDAIEKAAEGQFALSLA
jgi:hypothetical protein